MECRMTKDDLLGALYLAQGIVDRRVTLPVLAHVLIQVSNREATILATDQEIGLRRRSGAVVSKRGAATANARVLYEIVRSLADGEIELRTDERYQLEVKQGRSQFRIVGIDPEEFPAMPAAPEAKTKAQLSIDAENLRRMLELTLFASSADEARPALCGVCFERRDGLLNVVASDGHRLSLVSRPLKGVRADASVILSRKAVTEMLKVLDGLSGEVQLTFAGGVVFLGAGDVELAMRTVQAEFPSYEAVIPRESKRALRIPAGRWSQALRRVGVLAVEQTHPVRLTLDSGKVEMWARNTELGEAREEVEAEYTGDTFTIGFNVRYLLDVLGLFPGDTTVAVELEDDESPTIFRVPDEPEFLYVLMPMRLS